MMVNKVKWRHSNSQKRQIIVKIQTLITIYLHKVDERRTPSLNKLDQTSQREIVNETEIEKVQPQQNNQANDKITNYNFNNEQEVKPQKDEKTLSVSDLKNNEKSPVEPTKDNDRNKTDKFIKK
ncbi:hypothetical protein ACVPOW_11800 [Staphylococcus aureus]